jgi:predicted membrane chloride channel (bestrophin family)
MEPKVVIYTFAGGPEREAAAARFWESRKLWYASKSDKEKRIMFERDRKCFIQMMSSYGSIWNRNVL